VKDLCKKLEVSRSGFYAWKRRRGGTKRAENDSQMLDSVQRVYNEQRGLAGSRRIHGALRREGIRVSRKRVARLMKRGGLRARQRQKYRACTDSTHGLPVAPNLLDRQFKKVRFFRQVWVGDVTYVRTSEGWLYLAIVLDVWSRRIVGWAMGTNIGTALSQKALQAAITNVGGPPAMFHSDRGVEYAGKDFRDLLREHRIDQSMSHKGDCWDNAMAESFFGTLKKELLYLGVYSRRDEARLAIFEYIEVFYNRIRRHSALGYQSPDAFMRAAAA
jgi:putative transposase